MSEADRASLKTFLSEAFAGDFDDTDFDHCLGGLHVIAEDDRGTIVGHAALVQRHLEVSGAVLRTGYVEAVAVAAHMRRRGIGDTVMERIDAIIRRSYDLGALGASDAGRPLYLRRGWQPWTGPLGVCTAHGVRSTPGDRGSVLVLLTGRSADEDTSGLLVCERRSGDSW
ncbi:GNAT family N-acetyltransferase [Gordonia humi]|uniref:Aminoglycoside 2'-N-acetyltransferase I n=1 Tax=Gordonia humi TaxID=686429 RepID=A0A840F394_9ACTN|nr:GNAT family N-acetyltransferase [Gordonia humi]MBB4136938.1 aminoglycoside 2'-N-acetyltransferase I [Gordonia humi]